MELKSQYTKSENSEANEGNNKKMKYIVSVYTDIAI